MALSPKDKQGVMIGALAVTGIVGLFVVTRLLGKPELDEKLCRFEGSRAHYVILVDKTDPLTDGQRRKVTEEVMALVEGDARVPTDTRLTLAFIESTTGGVSAPAFDKCAPARGQQANDVYQNPKRVEERYQREFRTPLIELLDGYVAGGGAGTSPIIEAIQDIAYSQGRTKDPVTHLVVFSDFLEHTPDYSHYAAKANFDPRAFLDTPYGSRFVFPLKDTKVTLFYLLREDPRATSIQRDDRHIAFWVNYFQMVGANIELVRKVP